MARGIAPQQTYRRNLMTQVIRFNVEPDGPYPTNPWIGGGRRPDGPYPTNPWIGGGDRA